MEYPRPDACRALMPTPDPHPPGPPSRPMVCHMPKGHDGPHALTRRPGPIDRRWEGDAPPVTADLPDRAADRERECTPLEQMLAEMRAEAAANPPQPPTAEEALASLRELTACCCEPAWTERGRHESHCCSDWREEVDVLTAALAARPAPDDGEARELARASEALRTGVEALPEHLRGDGPCSRCGTNSNPVWFTDNEFWNAVVRSTPLPWMDGEGDGFMCPNCFIRLADERGYYVTGWRIVPGHWETHDEREHRLRGVVAATEEGQ